MGPQAKTAPEFSRFLDLNAFRLFFCGMSMLFWELVLIRWLSACIRIIGYYSNFVLIAAFFGLGAGALLARYRFRLHHFIFPAIALTLVLSVFLGGFYHENPDSPDEFIWLGFPGGVDLSQLGNAPSQQDLPVGFVLVLSYVLISMVFIIFGQWIGHLFKAHPPLWAYSVEVFGSILGILLFALVSYLQLPPVVWFVIGFAGLLLVMEPRRLSYLVAFACAAVILIFTQPFSDQFIWSPYYKIHAEPITDIYHDGKKATVHFDDPVGYLLTVNNDFHQMLLDLRDREEEPPFFDSWREIYDYPYRETEELPEGPILIVGAGTGNDVSAALRGTDREVVAVEIDPAILRLGRELHLEEPYQDPRVRIVNDDARSFFQKTDTRFAQVVFGYLDSHTLLSSFSSVRLDNFVYTLESLEQVERILVPGGKVYLTFCSVEDWIDERIIGMLDSVFDEKTHIYADKEDYACGAVYTNRKLGSEPARGGPAEVATTIELPVDNWPFLYLRGKVIPRHYIVFIALALALGFASLLFLPRGERRIKFPFFFLGAAFFLIETSNVVSLSILYGSTWYVNVTVFTGILFLVLLGNLTSFFIAKPRIGLYIALLTLGILIALAVEPTSLLGIDSGLLKAAAAIALFLSPVYFASLIFASLIKNEENLYQAYGSNILGAVVGGACEYMSLMHGFKFLLVITLVFYLLVYLFLKMGRSAKPIPG